MGLEYVSNPQVFLAPITAVNGVQGVNNPYPLLTTYQSWVSTGTVNTSAFPIPGTWTMLDQSGSFIVTVGNVIQSPTDYSIDRNNRRLTFSSIITAGIEIGATQLATAAPSSANFNDLQSASANFINLTAANGFINDLRVVNLTALSATFNVVDVTVYELSGFRTTGDLTVVGSISATENLTVVGSISAAGTIYSPSAPYTANLSGSIISQNSFNTATGGCFSIVAGGNSNALTGTNAVIGGGSNNRIFNAVNSLIGGGNANCITSTAAFAVIVGGNMNSACNTSALVVGGRCNTASGSRSTVSGGYCNISSGTHAFIGGGARNTASAGYSFIAGGSNNDTKAFTNTFILGTALTASQSNTTYVNNLSSSGNISTGGNLNLNGYYATSVPLTTATAVTVPVLASTIVFTGATTVTLPAASTYPGRNLSAKVTTANAVISNTSNVVSLSGTTANNIILPQTGVAAAGKWAQLQSDGTNWVVIAAN